MAHFHNLIEKYNKQAPRYTSYPTALYFSEIKDKRTAVDVLAERKLQPHNLSLYIHIPFCASLCWYCGCTKVITRNPGDSNVYLEKLFKEMRLLRNTLHEDSEIVHVHMGGGTPTFLSPEEFRQIGAFLKQHFTLGKAYAFDIETDPRTITEEHVAALAEIGCNRVSIGIQDIYEDTQKAINRIQPMDLNERVTHWFRSSGISHINVDLVYGLPFQTVDRFKNTLSKVMTLNPDRFAIFNYAHVPWMMPSQNLLEKHPMPDAFQKFDILRMTSEYLTSSDYSAIGMDHFAKKEDELVIAQKSGTLQRNFQGYSTRAEVDIYGLGMSSISQIGTAYLQNVKDLNTYYEQIDSGQWPHWKSCYLSKDDEIRRDTIMRLMCDLAIDFNTISGKWSIDAKNYFSSSIEKLVGMERDQLIEWTDNGFAVTPAGRFFIRNIATVFDAYIYDAKKNAHYSKTI